jgi:hypothetical protein
VTTTPKVKALGADLIARKPAPEPEPQPATRFETLMARKVYQLGEPLNFRVKPAFKRLFKSTAAQHGLKMNDLLVEAFDLWMREKGREPP